MRHFSSLLSGLLLLLLAAGCSDPPAYNRTITQEYDFNPAARPRTTRPIRQPVKITTTPSATGYDPLIATDPNTTSKDPLLSGNDTSQRDLMANTSTVMPTVHSHWLRGSIINARISVVLNSIKLGDYTTNIDKDITMKCRKGVNTITITYTPSGIGAMANLDILESEHNPPIPPLASFRSNISAADTTGSDPNKPITRTFTFNAN